MRPGWRICDDHIDAQARAAVWSITDFQLNRDFFASATFKVPARFHRRIADVYVSRFFASGHVEANRELQEIAAGFGASRLSLAASDSEVVAESERHALDVARMVGDGAALDSDGHRRRLERYARNHGVRAPECEKLAGVVGRMSDPSWWRRALRRSVVREVERIAIRLGMVHRRAALYVSDEGVERRGEQCARNARMLDRTEAESDDGITATLADLSARGVSNPAIRRAELMTRIAGFERFATAAGHVGLFVTWTCPSRMHARLSESGEVNPRWDGTAPRDAARYLSAQWAKARAALHRRGIAPYGFRISEPHHDGCPHWHMLLFVPAPLRAALVDVMGRYAREVDAAELSTAAAQRARFHVVDIDPERGSAAGYIAKYVAKNIDGHAVGADGESDRGDDASSTAARVDAWRSTWGVRQFQQIGGPGVTVWRELRRVREKPQGELFDRFWTAADAGDWCAFVEAQGGAIARRADRPLQLWRSAAIRYGLADGVLQRVQALTSYGEPAPARVRGVCMGEAKLDTRWRKWVVRPARARAGVAVRRSLGPVAITVRPVPSPGLAAGRLAAVLDDAAAILDALKGPEPDLWGVAAAVPAVVSGLDAAIDRAWSAWHG